MTRLKPFGGHRLMLVAAVLLALWTGRAAADDLADPPVLRSSAGQFTLLRPIRMAPGTAVHQPDGRAIDLTGFRGRVILLNFWASWCLPCAYEMPSLDRLAAGDSRVVVVAVSIDQDGAAAVMPFARAGHLTHLTLALDPDQRLGALSAGGVASGALPLWGLPITYLIDKRGRVIGYITGVADWESPAAKDFINYFVTIS